MAAMDQVGGPPPAGAVGRQPFIDLVSIKGGHQLEIPLASEGNVADHVHNSFTRRGYRNSTQGAPPVHDGADETRMLHAPPAFSLRGAIADPPSRHGHQGDGGGKPGAGGSATERSPLTTSCTVPSPPAAITRSCPRAAAPADRASASPNRPVTSTRASGRESSRSRSQPTDRMARPLPATGLTLTMGAIDTQGIVTIRVNHHGALPYPA